MNRSARMGAVLWRFHVVGRGRVGLALHASLRRLRGGARLLPGRAVVPWPRGVAPTAWLLAVPDAHLPAVTARLVPLLGAQDVALHLAGILGPEVLVAAGVPAARAGALHPLMARSSPHRRVPVGDAFLFEGGARALAAARALGRHDGARVVLARRVDRARYHAGAALVATGAAALARGAAEVFSAALTPAPTERALRAMVASLLESVAVNVREDGPRRALASPLLRRDTESVARHLRALRAHPDAHALYHAAVAAVLRGLRDVLADADEVAVRARAVLAAEDLRGHKP